jgi:hypothetical protein
VELEVDAGTRVDRVKFRCWESGVRVVGRRTVAKGVAQVTLEVDGHGKWRRVGRWESPE